MNINDEYKFDKYVHLHYSLLIFMSIRQGNNFFYANHYNRAQSSFIYKKRKILSIFLLTLQKLIKDKSINFPAVNLIVELDIAIINVKLRAPLFGIRYQSII